MRVACHENRSGQWIAEDACVPPIHSMALSLPLALSSCRTTLTGLAAVPVAANQLDPTRMTDGPIHLAVRRPHDPTCPIAQSDSPMIVGPPASTSHLLAMMTFQEAHAAIVQMLTQETLQSAPIWSMADCSLRMIFHPGQVGPDGVVVMPLVHSLLRPQLMVKCLLLISKSQLALADKADVQVLPRLLPHNYQQPSGARSRGFTLIDSSNSKALCLNQHQTQP